MRILAFACMGIVLLSLDGAFCRILHLEWIHPDPVLVLTVYVALFIRTAMGILMVAFLGAASDSFAGTPPGMLMSSYVFVWMLASILRRFVMRKRMSAQLSVVFAASLFHSLLMFAYLLALDAHSGVLWINLKAMFPLALFHVLLAIPILPLAKWVWPPTTGWRHEMAI